MVRRNTRGFEVSPNFFKVILWNKNSLSHATAYGLPSERLRAVPTLVMVQLSQSDSNEAKIVAHLNPRLTNVPCLKVIEIWVGRNKLKFNSERMSGSMFLAIKFLSLVLNEI